jgi:hypothetical protein
MKVVAILQGASLLRMSQDDVMPTSGVPLPQVVNLLNATYKFAATPGIPAGVQLQLLPILQFQNGELTKGSERFSVVQLTIMNNGIVAVSNTTSGSDAIIEDIISLLDTSLGFRIAASQNRLTHYSNLVVEFDRGVEECIAAIGRMEDIINDTTQQTSPGPFKIKRLTFGREAYNAPEVMLTATIDAAEKADFLIERRVGSSFSENRYYSGAPFSTTDHVRVLETMERAFVA